MTPSWSNPPRRSPLATALRFVVFCGCVYAAIVVTGSWLLAADDLAYVRAECVAGGGRSVDERDSRHRLIAVRCERPRAASERAL